MAPAAPRPGVLGAGPTGAAARTARPGSVTAAVTHALIAICVSKLDDPKAQVLSLVRHHLSGRQGIQILVKRSTPYTHDAYTQVRWCASARAMCARTDARPQSLYRAITTSTCLSITHVNGHFRWLPGRKCKTLGTCARSLSRHMQAIPLVFSLGRIASSTRSLACPCNDSPHRDPARQCKPLGSRADSRALTHARH